MNDRHLWPSWLRRSALVLSAAVLCMMPWNTASAQLTENKTVVTFNTPVEVPGSDPQVLPAGSYTFKVVDSKVNRNIVQVSNKEETHVYTTVLTVPTHREVETDKTVMTFEERAAGEPQALRAWFYPHEKTGQEFVYSKDRAAELAKSSNSPVPYSETASTSASTSPASRSATEASPSPIMTMQPTGQSAPYTQQAQVNAPAPVARQQAQPNRAVPVEARQQTTPEPVQTASNLPSTASDLPGIALIGCLLLALGVSIKTLCER